MSNAVFTDVEVNVGSQQVVAPFKPCGTNGAGCPIGPPTTGAGVYYRQITATFTATDWSADFVVKLIMTGFVVGTQYCDVLIDNPRVTLLS